MQQQYRAFPWENFSKFSGKGAQPLPDPPQWGEEGHPYPHPISVGAWRLRRLDVFA